MTADGLQWRNVQIMGHTADLAHLNWDRSVVVKGTSIDLQGRNIPSTDNPTSSKPSWKEWIPSVEYKTLKSDILNNSLLL